jgi:DNA modification methylase
MIKEQFAPEMDRTPEGWIDMGSDAKLRKEMFFPPDVMSHPAKMNLYMAQAMIDYVADPGEIIMDPFGGTGTTMIAALQGIRVILLEIEDGYHELQCQAREEMEMMYPNTAGLVTLLKGDNRFLMPIPVHHAMTSPPYSTAMKVKNVRKLKDGAKDDWLVQMDKQMADYCKSDRNISNLNSFLYTRAMEKIYTLMYQSVLPGGTVSINTKDRIVGGKRQLLSEWVFRVFDSLGAERVGHFKFKAMGSGFTKIARSQGKNVVDEEDVMVFRKPE